MALTTPNALLHSDMDTYESDNNFFIPLRLFIDATELFIKPDPKELLWNGWFRHIENHVTIDFKQLRANVGDSTFSIQTNQACWLDEQLFLDTQLLSQWFDFTFTIDRNQQTMRLFPKYLLPYQRRQNRARRQQFAPASEKKQIVRTIDDQYAWLTPPALSIGIKQDTQHDAQSSFMMDYTLSFDALGLAVYGAGSLAWEQQTLTDQNRLTFKRRLTQPNSDQTVRQSEIQFGDIYVSGSQFVSGGGAGLGLSIDIGDAFKYNPTHTTTLTGDGVPGWEMEVFQNDSLVQLGSVGSDGRYVVENVQLEPDLNRFDVYLYGPEGQVQQREHKLWGGGSEMPVGKHALSVSLLDVSQSLLQYSQSPEQTEYRYQSNIRFAYGISRNLQIGLGFTDLRSEESNPNADFKTAKFVSIDGRLSFGPGLIIGNTVRNLSGGNAFSARYLATLGSVRLSAGVEKYVDFVSEQIKPLAANDQETQASLSGHANIPVPLTWRLQYTGLRRPNTENTQESRNWQSKIGWRMGRLSFNNDLSWKKSLTGTVSKNGKIAISGRDGIHSLRASLGYKLNQSFDTIDTSWRIALTRDAHFQFQFQKTLDSDTWNITQTFNRSMPSFSWSLSHHTQENGNWRLRVGIRTSLGWRPERLLPLFSNKNLASSGSATVRGYVDKNGNGIRESDEPNLAFNGHLNSKFELLSDGRLWWGAVPADSFIELANNQLLVDDAFLTPREPRIEFRTHSGSRLDLNIPFVKTIDIEGYLFRQSAQESTEKNTPQPAVNVELRLISLDHDGWYESKTTYDGYFNFLEIPSGRYRLTPTNNQSVTLKRLDLNDENLDIIELDNVILPDIPRN